MADFGADRRVRSSWARLKEDRFTNVDVVLVLGALAITGLVAVLSGAWLLR
jgi:hypothetical protein